MISNGIESKYCGDRSKSSTKFSASPCVCTVRSLCALRYEAYKFDMIHVLRDSGVSYPPPPCISYANVHNYYGPYAYCGLDKGVACAQHIQLPTHMCAGHMR